MAEQRRPWMKFYPSDWRADPRLRMCSLAARGLWADMLALMHEADPYGHLLVEGQSPRVDELSMLVGAPLDAVEVALAELERRAVFSRTADGTIFSRRMVRDRAKEIKDRENGKGGGNPNLKKSDSPGVNPHANPGVGEGDKAHMPEARVQKKETEAIASVSAEPTATVHRLPVQGRDEIKQAVEEWNAFAARHGLSQVAKVTDQRRAKLRARLKDAGGITGWQAGLARIEQRCRWMIDGSARDGWRVTMDFLLREANFTKLTEGGYDRNKPRPDNPGGNGFATLLAEEFAQGKD